MATANVALARSNVLFITANSAWDKANIANITADRAWNHANAVYAFANAMATVANLAFIHANNAYAQANTGGGGGGALTVRTDIINATRYVAFANGLSGTLATANVSTGITFNPSSNTLTVNGSITVKGSPVIYSSNFNMLRTGKFVF